MVERIQAQPTVRELYAERLVDGGRDRAGGRAARSSTRPSRRCAPPTNGCGRRSPSRRRRRREPHQRTSTTGDAVETAVPADRLRALNEQLLVVPDGFTVNPKLARQLERRRETIDAGRDRLGPGRGARVRLAPRGRDPDPAVRPGHRAGDVRAPAPRPPRPALGRDRRADPAPAGRERLVRGLQLAALRVRGARLRVRLLGRRARRARALGGAVRRLRERRPDRDRPVHRRRALEVEPDLAADAAPPARVRGQRPGALERAARAIPPARRAGEHPRRELHDGGPVLPPPPAAGARRRSPGRSS